jgi:hypothetical protein
VFRLAYRQTEGLIGSLMRLLGLDLPIPDHTTLSRRAETLEVPGHGRAAAPMLAAVLNPCSCWWTARA